MFERLGSLTYRYRFLVVAAWVVGAIAAVTLAPSLAAEGMTDQTAFLPAGTVSVEARDVLERGFPGATAASSATLSFSRAAGLTDADRAWIEDTADWATGPEAPAAVRDAVTGVVTAERRPELESMLRSTDGRLEMITLNLDVPAAGGAAQGVIDALRGRLADTTPAGLAAHVTGTAGISTDYLDAIVRGTDSTTAVTVVLVVVILLLIYRAPLAAMVPLVTIGAAFLVARGVLGVLAAAGWKVSSLLDTFIVVLVFGVGTDYAIFLISRFREEVGRTDWHRASMTTVRRIGAVISASAATVIVGLGSMAFADFGMIQTTGPALAVAVAVTLVAGLTLAPALLAIFGHYLFWPLHMRTGTNGEPGGLFARMASAVSRRPGLVTVLLLVVLAVPASAMSQMRTNFDVLAELPANSDARAGFDDVAAHLGRGKVVQATGAVEAPGSDLLAPASLARLRDLTQALVATDGVATVTNLVSPDGDGVVPDGLRPSRQLRTMADDLQTDDSEAGEGDPEALLDADVDEGLGTVQEYLALLGDGFPDVAASTAFRDATADLADARDVVARARDSAAVDGQLRALARALTSPAAAAGGGDTSTSLITDYLAELRAAEPAIGRLPAFAAARSAAARLERKPSIDAALDASTALSRLADRVETGWPDATLFPDSLARTTEAKEARERAKATFAAASDDLGELASLFATRADDVFLPVGLTGDAGTDIDDAVAAFVSDDRSTTRLYLSTDDDPYSQTAFATVRRAQGVMAAAAPGFGPGTGAYLGGPTAEFADVQDVLGGDFQRVAVITVLGILVVLVLLLRAVVAPLYLVGTVLLSCATAIGLSAWYFQSVLGHAGVSFYLPLLVFVLLVALGSDYNIFLMSRVREESEGRPIRDGIRIASGRTGAVITSAGLILAGTFGSMATAPLAVLFQVGVAVAVGVLIDTFVVRSILVPAITMLVGDWAWWPSGARGLAALGRLPGGLLGREGAGTVAAVAATMDGAAAGDSAAIAAATEDGSAAGPTGRWRLGVSLAMLAILPMLLAGLLTWSLSDASDLGAVSAAVVNEDEGATTTAADGTTERLALGADLAQGLTAGGSTAGVTWVEARDAAAARGGLADGRYGAVLTIPADYSRPVASLRGAAAGGDRPGARPRLQLATGDQAGYLLGSIARSIRDTIALSAAERLTTGYLGDVLLAVTTAQGRVADSAADAGGVATGSTDLASGAESVSGVTGELVSGLEEMASKTSDASTGFDRLAAGIDQLAVGTRQIATGASKLATGSAAAADGATKLADGVDRLAGGLDEMAKQTAPLPDTVDRLAAAAAGVSTGVDATAEGLGTLHSGLDDLGTLSSAVDDTAGQAADKTASVFGHAQTRADDAGRLATDAGSLTATVADLTGRLTDLSGDCAGLGGTDELCTRLAAIAADGPTVADAAGGLAGDAGTLAGRLGNLAADAGEAAGYAGATSDLTGKLKVGVEQAATAAGQLQAGITTSPAPGVPSLRDTAALVASGTAGMADRKLGLPALTRGIADAADGADGLSAGASKLAGGMSRLAGGVDSLASGAALTADGAARIAGGTSQAADGAAKLQGAVDDVVDAGRLVQSEADGLAEDGQSVADDADALESALERDAAAIPTWSTTDRDALAGSIASPVDLEATRETGAPTTSSGLASLFMALALWVGALASYLVLPALPSHGRGSDRRTRWWPAVAGLAAGLGVGAVQALLMVTAGSLALGVDPRTVPALLAMALVTALAAAAVVQGMVVLAGMRGWLLALVLIVVQVAAAGVPWPLDAAPALVQAVHPLLPMTYAVEAFRTLLTGSGASVLPAVVVQLAWAAGALGVTLFALHRRGARPSARAAVAPV